MSECERDSSNVTRKREGQNRIFLEKIKLIFIVFIFKSWFFRGYMTCFLTSSSKSESKLDLQYPVEENGI